MLGAFLGLLRRLLSKKVLGLLIIPVVIIALGFWKGRAIYSIAIKYLPTKQAKTVKVDKSDPNYPNEHPNYPNSWYSYVICSIRIAILMLRCHKMFY